VAWVIAFAALAHEDNARAFGGTLGGVAALSAMLRTPVTKDSHGEGLQAACLALGNLAAAHRPNQVRYRRPLALPVPASRCCSRFSSSLSLDVSLSLSLSLSLLSVNGVFSDHACARGLMPRLYLVPAQGVMGQYLAVERLLALVSDNTPLAVKKVT